MKTCTHENCVHTSTVATQSLEEVEFERGLWTAAINGDVGRTRELLGKGNDPNRVDSAGYTPLHYACRWGRTDVCEILARAGGCVHATTSSGGATPLHRAAYCGHSNIVQFLYEYKADLNARDSDGMTALHKASEQGHLDVVQLLISLGANTKVTDNRNRTPLDIAKNTEIKKLLSYYGDHKHEFNSICTYGTAINKLIVH